MKCPHCGKQLELGLRKVRLGPDGKRKIPLTRKEIWARAQKRRKERLAL
jgi:hypothetical protein